MDADETTSREAVLNNAEALVTFLRRRLAELPAETPLGAGAEARAASVLAPIFALDGVPHLLFTVRSNDLPSHKGEISFPGGKHEPDDQSLAWTALRETHEELGIEPARVEVVGPLPAVFAAVSNYLIAPYVGWLGEGFPTMRINRAEVTEVITAPLAELARTEIYHAEDWLRFGVTHTVHFFDYGPSRIWGATGRMLYSLLQLLPTE